MLQLKITKGGVVKYCSISSWSNLDFPFTFYSVKQFLTDTNMDIKLLEGKIRKMSHLLSKKPQVNLVGSFRLIACQHIGHWELL